MMKLLQISFIFVLAVAVVFFSAWRYFRGGAWWIAVIGALFVYVGFLSSYFWGSTDAWHNKTIKFVFDIFLSSEFRAIFTLLVLLIITVCLGIVAYKALPKDTAYYDVRVYKNADLPPNYQIGAKVTIHSRTDGLTHKEIVADDGAAVFRKLMVPTTLRYQVEVTNENPPYMIGGNDNVKKLPDLLDINLAEISIDKRLVLNMNFMKSTVPIIPRPDNYLQNVDELGDQILQVENAPFGVPVADLIINRLGYVLGYDLKRKLPRWVAYSIGPTNENFPRKSKFIPDPAISIDKQAKSSDYRTPDYDRGHMISPADLYFKGPVIVQEAYYMSTVAPQTPWLNRILWRILEQRVRAMVKSKQKPAFIIAGPLFKKPSNDSQIEFKTIGESKIAVPDYYFRIILMIDSLDNINVFSLIVPNAMQGSTNLDNYLVSIDEIEERSGLTFFPFLDPGTESRVKTEFGEIW